MIRFFGPIGNHSGYGNAVRNFATAFSKSKHHTKFMFGEKAEAKYKDFISTLNNYQGPTNIDFYLHGPPYNTHRSKAEYKIAYFYWEADRLPLSWEKMIHTVNELWVPCELVKNACLKAKFRGPIKIVPTPQDPWDHNDKIQIPSPDGSLAVSDKTVKFYSIFQWHERKGWRELISAYCRAFNKLDDVILILKVNPLNTQGLTVKEIHNDIKSIKPLNSPRIFLSTDIVPERHIQALHNSCDVYVAPNHGEGWGMPIHDAAFAGNKIITTGFGGFSEFLKGSASIIKHRLGPVKNMGWSRLYSPSQNWAYPDVDHLISLLKEKDIKGSDKARDIAYSMTTDEIAKIINREIKR